MALNLSPLPDASWFAISTEPKIRVFVAGTAGAPNPACRETLDDLLARWSEVRHSVETFLRAMPADVRVPLDPRPTEAFAAEDCGFDGPLSFEALSVTDPAKPARARITFFTGQPDGYVTFEVSIESGRLFDLSAFAS